jgi:delta24-sterol reductase
MPSSQIVKKDFILGSLNLFMLSCLSALFVYYIVLSGYSGIYFTFTEHGVLFSVFTGLLYLISLDFALYFAHRTFHIPYLYKKFHWVHHRNTTPIAINSLAIHPVEVLVYHAFTLLPIVIIPLHYISVIGALFYTNYVSLIDHSGIKFHSWLFWQSPSQFHDDHHKYFHVNYGQTFWFWDWMFGTWRQKGRRYGPQNFEKKKDLTVFPSNRKEYIDYSEGSNFITKHRSAIIVIFCLPISFIFTSVLNVWRKIQRKRNLDMQHPKSISLVQADCVQSKDQPPRKICTDRKSWKSLSTRLFDKSSYSKIQISHLTNILELDKEHLIVRTEPLVTVGQMADYLIPLGYSLAVCLEIREATLGGLAMGVGMTTHSHKAGLFQESVVSYEIITPSGDYLKVTKIEHPDLFKTLPWSHGTLGILVGLELKIIPIKPFVYLQYTPVFSQSEYCTKIRELAIKPDAADFLEMTIFDKGRAVIMEGWFHDGKGGSLPSINPINHFSKPWFFKHVETFLTKGPASELIPLKDYIFRHNRSIFWVLQDMVPYGNRPLARYCLGWMYPPSIAFLKLTMTSQIRKMTFEKQVFQDIVLPLTSLSQAIDLSDKLFSLYPLLVYPCRLYDHGNASGQLRPPREIDRVPGTTFGMYCDLGIYGVPKNVKEHKAYNPIQTMRTLEEFIRREGGYSFLYADTFMTREEFSDMFDLTLYEKVRKQYRLEMSFPDLYEKTRPEFGVQEVAQK